MPKIGVDFFRETFYELVKRDGFKYMDKFMMSGRQPFQFVLNICRETDNVVVFGDKIVAQLPRVVYKRGCMGTEIPATILLFKPISIAFAFNMATMDLRSFSPALIPMLKGIHERMTKVCIQYSYNPSIHRDGRKLKMVFETSLDVPDDEDGVTLQLCTNNNFSVVIKSFAVSCRKLKIEHANIDTIFEEINIYTSALHNVRELVIDGRLSKKLKCLKDTVRFFTFISTNFPNLETFNATISVEYCENNVWNWKDNKITGLANCLPCGIKGCISYKNSSYKTFTVDKKKYPDVQIDGNECYKNFPVTDDFSLKFFTKGVVA